MPGAAVESRRVIAKPSTINRALSKITTCFQRAITMQNQVAHELDTEKTLAFTALFSDDILDGAEALDKLLRTPGIDRELTLLLAECKDSLETIVVYAQDLEEEAKAQLDKACRNEFVGLFNIRNLLGNSEEMMSDLKVILASLEDARQS